MESDNERKNVECGYESILRDYNEQISRFKRCEDKANMVLVFNAASLTMLNIIFPIARHQLFIVEIILFSIYMTLMVLTLIMIFNVLFPKSILLISTKEFCDREIYKMDAKEFLMNQIQVLYDAIAENRKIIEKKQFFNQIAFWLTGVNTITMFVMAFLNFCEVA